MSSTASVCTALTHRAFLVLVGPGLQQDARTLNVTVLNGLHQRRPSVLVSQTNKYNHACKRIDNTQTLTNARQVDPPQWPKNAPCLEHSCLSRPAPERATFQRGISLRPSSAPSSHSDVHFNVEKYNITKNSDVTGSGETRDSNPSNNSLTTRTHLVLQILVGAGLDQHARNVNVTSVRGVH
jgi:hypothetical protein